MPAPSTNPPRGRYDDGPYCLVITGPQEGRIVALTESGVWLNVAATTGRVPEHERPAGLRQFNTASLALAEAMNMQQWRAFAMQFEKLKKKV